MTTKTPNHPDRFSACSGAPSIQPSLAATASTSGAMSEFRKSQADSYAMASADLYDSEKIACLDPETSSRSSTISTTDTTDTRARDIKSWSAGFDRMHDERLDSQRFTMSGKKSDEVSTAALGAKVERALGRRMVGQDAVFTRRRQVPVETSTGVEVRS